MRLDVDGLLADAVAREAARERTAERLLRQAAAEEATLRATLVNAAERRATVGLRTALGRTHRGAIRAVGRDFVVVDVDPDRAPVFVSMWAVASVRGAPAVARDDVAMSPRPPPVDASFAAVVGGLAADRPRVQIGIRGEDGPVNGALQAAGADVLTVRLDNGDDVVVPTAGVAELVLLDR